MRMRAERRKVRRRTRTMLARITTCCLGPKSTQRAERIYINIFLSAGTHECESGGLSVCEIQIVRISNFHSFRIKLPWKFFCRVCRFGVSFITSCRACTFKIYIKAGSARALIKSAEKRRCNTISRERAAQPHRDAYTLLCVRSKSEYNI